MTTIPHTIEPYYVPERAHISRAHSNSKLVKGLFISLAIHLVGLVIVVTFTTFTHTSPKVQHAAPISATLVYPKVTQPALPQSAVEKPEPDLPVSSLTEIVEAPDTAISNVKKAETNTQVEPTTELASPEVKNDSAKAPSPNAPKIAEDLVLPPTTQDNNSGNANRQAGRLNLSPRAGASQFFKRREQQVIAEEGLRSAKEFRRKQNSPDLIDPRKDEEDTSYEERPVVNVNCSSNTNQALTVLSTWTGGTLECSKGSDYERFIEARIAKEPKKD